MKLLINITNKIIKQSQKYYMFYPSNEKLKPRSSWFQFTSIYNKLNISIDKNISKKIKILYTNI